MIAAGAPSVATRGRGSRWIPRIMIALLAATVVAIVIYERTRRPPPDRSAAIQARIELAAGEVMVDDGGGEAQAMSETPLMAGAKVRTGNGARALVRLPDGSSAFLRGKSAIELAEAKVLLHSGEYWLDAPAIERAALVHQVGDVGVAAADAGLSIKRAGDAVEVYVARGMAVLTAPKGRVEIHAGELATVKAGAPKVQPLAFWEDWTGGMADFGAVSVTIAAGNGEIYAVDSGTAAGTAAARLQIKSQSVRAAIRNGLSETEVDQTFFNPSARAVEGWYWFSIPPGASVTGFAVETNGTLVEGEFIERRDAAKKYGQAKSSGHAPAILEWIDSSTYRARIYPIAAASTRRVVLRYIELRPVTQGRLSYVYPMAGRTPMRIGEFALSVDLGDEGKRMKIATLAEAKIEADGTRVTMRRSGYTPRVDFQLEAELPERKPKLRVARFDNRADGADYLMARYTPDVAWSTADKLAADVVVAVDTSAAGDESARSLKASVAEAVLRSLSSDDHFALIALDVRPRVLYPTKGLAKADDKEIAKALEALADHAAGGATDLASLFEVALERVHASTQPAVVYVGDGIATSGEQTGEQLIERLRRSLNTSRARLFTVGVGPEADDALLAELARAGGGISMRVDDARHATARALELAASFKVPTLTDFELDLGAGLDEPFINVSGKVSRGTEVVMLARTHHDMPTKVVVRGMLGKTPIEQEVEVEKDTSVVSAFVPRLWAAEYVRRLLGAAAGPEAERGRISELGIDYGLMTPFTSVLSLESEAAYSRMGIKRRRSHLRGVKLTALDRRSERNLEALLHAGDMPEVMIGCSKLEPSSEMDELTEQDSDDKEGGSGTRAKGEEGSMGNPNSKLTGKRYGVRGPSPGAAGEADAPAGDGWGRDDSNAADPHAARQSALREAQEFGMIGLLAPASFGSGGGEGRAAKNNKNEADKDSGARHKGEEETGAAAFWRRAVRATCSAAARRPLAQRARVWRKRLKTADNPRELLERYVSATRACELDDWRSERAFLELMQQHIVSEGGAQMVLSLFAARPNVQQYLAKLILRRAVDKRLVASVEAVLFGGAVNWDKLDRELSAIEGVDERIAKLREAMARAPDDPNGIIRLVSLLAEAERTDEALMLGRRLRERGLMTLKVARQLGDVLARAGHEDEAVRTYSEIVEFDPDSVASRRLLGDIYLSRGWYGPAYRQFKTSVADDPSDALGWLRLASAAAGAGRIDEALRLDRKVASAQGRPGPDDPRRWARLWSAARLAKLLHQPPKGTSASAVQRKLKELQLFQGEGTLVVLTWEDLTSDVTLVTKVDDKAVALGEATDAAAVGLSASMLSRADSDRVELVARLRSLPRQEPLTLSRHDIRWDGKKFGVAVKKVSLEERSTAAAL